MRNAAIERWILDDAERKPAPAARGRDEGWTAVVRRARNSGCTCIGMWTEDDTIEDLVAAGMGCGGSSFCCPALDLRRRQLGSSPRHPDEEQVHD